MGKNREIPDYTKWWSIYIELKEIYISAFKWLNLPSTVSARYLELSLYNAQRAVFFYEDVMDAYVALKAVNHGTLDIYGEPISVTAYGVNGYNRVMEVMSPFNKDAEGVIVYDNYMWKSPKDMLMDYAKRIYLIQRTIDINVRQQRTPRIPVAESIEFQNSLKTFYKKVDEGDDYIVLDKDMMDGKTNFDMTLKPAPYLAGDLQELKKKVWNEALSFIGILNNSADKKERLVSDEAMLGNGRSIAKRNSRLEQRQIFVNKVNEKYGLNIEVEVNSDFIDEVMKDKVLEEAEKGVEE